MDESEDIVFPIYFAVEESDVHSVAISTRSTYDLIEILRAAINVPKEYTGKGVARPYPKPGPAGKDIRIHASTNWPEQGNVAVNHRGYWFYIDDSDMSTKRFYVLVRTLWSVSIASASDQKTAPVFTIPVSRETAIRRTL